MKERTGLKGLSEGVRDLYMIDPRIIQVKDGFNVRIDYGNIDELKESIRENGLKIPLRVYKEDSNIFLTDGHRRLRAINLLLDEGEDIKSVPCISEPKNYSEEQRIFDIFLTGDSKALDDIERGILFQRLVDRGYTQAEIAKKIGRSQMYVSNAIAATNLPKLVKNAVASGEIAVSTAVSVARMSNTEKEVIDTVQAAVRIAQENGKGRATINHVQAVSKPKAIPRVSISSSFKSYKEFIEENSIVLKEFFGYKVAAAVIPFLNGEMTEAEFIDVIKND